MLPSKKENGANKTQILSSIQIIFKQRDKWNNSLPVARPSQKKKCRQILKP